MYGHIPFNCHTLKAVSLQPDSQNCYLFSVLPAGYIQDPGWCQAGLQAATGVPLPRVSPDCQERERTELLCQGQTYGTHNLLTRRTLVQHGLRAFMKIKQDSSGFVQILVSMMIAKFTILAH